MRSNQEILDFVNDLREGHIKANKVLMEEVQRLGVRDILLGDSIIHKLNAESKIESARAEINLRNYIVDNLNHILNFISSEEK